MRKQNLIDQSERNQLENGMRVMKGQQEFVSYREDMSFRVWYGEEPDFFNEHWHSAVEIVLPHKGMVRCTVEGKVYEVGELDVLFIPAGKPHGLETMADSVRNLILFDPQCLQTIRSTASLRSVLDEVVFLTQEHDHPACGEIRVQLFELMRHYYDASPVCNLECYSMLLDIYARLSRHYLEQHPVAPGEDGAEDNIMTEPIRQALSRVSDYLNEHYAEKITLDSAAAVAGFSKFYFSRIFSQYVEMPFSQYLLRTRILAASKLLYMTDLRLLDIAIQSGFTSLSTFNRVFKNFHGCTPTEYRMLYREQKNVPPEENAESI